MPKNGKRSREHKVRGNVADHSPIKKGIPNWMATGAAAHFDRAGYAAYKKEKLGKFGAASEVRRIDPAEYAKVLTDKPFTKE